MLKMLSFFRQVYNAVLVLLVHASSCVNLEGFNESVDTLRWFYDGRVVCFSNSGKLDGQWQIAAAVFVAVSCILILILQYRNVKDAQIFLSLPLLLFLYMKRSMRIPQANLNWFDSTAVPHYHAMFRSGAKHWMVIMFYERVILLLVLVVFVLITRFDSNSSEGM
jgi:hypothetical protein